MTTTALTPKTLRHTTVVSPRTTSRMLAFEVAGQPRAYELRAELIRIGRGRSAEIGLDDGTVSRRHALVLTRPSGAVEVIDEHSAAGTYVNGERVHRRRLAHGDVLQIGKTAITYLDPASSGH